MQGALNGMRRRVKRRPVANRPRMFAANTSSETTITTMMMLDELLISPPNSSAAPVATRPSRGRERHRPLMSLLSLQRRVLLASAGRRTHGRHERQTRSGGDSQKDQIRVRKVRFSGWEHVVGAVEIDRQDLLHTTAVRRHGDRDHQIDRPAISRIGFWLTSWIAGRSDHRGLRAVGVDCAAPARVAAFQAFMSRASPPGPADDDPIRRSRIFP